MTQEIKKGNKGGTRKENHQTRHLTVGPDKGETPHWRQRTDRNPPKRKRREDLPPLCDLSLPQKHTRNHENHRSRDTFTNVTKVSIVGNSGKGLENAS
jgi:hypothetical protein